MNSPGEDLDRLTIVTDVEYMINPDANGLVVWLESTNDGTNWV